MKKLRLDKLEIEEMVSDLKEKLNTMQKNDGLCDKIDVKIPSLNNKQPAFLFWKPEVYCKMLSIVNNSKDEVAWYCIVDRCEEKNEFIVSDILLYPQYVTGVTVNTDDKKHTVWCEKLTDEQFASLRMQCHSHVNMSTSPSTVDTTYYSNKLKEYDYSGFYIFMITNKRQDIWIELYDYDNGILYETNDVVMQILDEKNNIIDDFINAELEKYIEPEPVKTYKVDYVKYSKPEKTYKNTNFWRYQKDYEKYQDDCSEHSEKPMPYIDFVNKCDNENKEFKYESK